MRFNQGISGAFHFARVTQTFQQTAHQGGLAGTQVAFQGHHVAGLKQASQPGTEGFRRGFVGQMQA